MRLIVLTSCTIYATRVGRHYEMGIPYNRFDGVGCGGIFPLVQKDTDAAIDGSCQEDVLGVYKGGR